MRSLKQIKFNFGGIVLNKFAHMITFFDENIINDVAIRLGDCQHYSDKISQQILSSNGVDIKSHLHFGELLKLLSKRRNIIVSFYCLKEKEHFYIFSDFFNHKDAFSESFHFFDDVNSAFMMCENMEKVIYVSLMKHGESVFQFGINVSDLENNISDAWQRDYIGIYNIVGGLPSISQIVDSLKYMLRNLNKSDIQMRNYIEKNALFIDQYVI